MRAFWKSHYHPQIFSFRPSRNIQIMQKIKIYKLCKKYQLNSSLKFSIPCIFFLSSSLEKIYKLCKNLKFSIPCIFFLSSSLEKIYKLCKNYKHNSSLKFSIPCIFFLSSSLQNIKYKNMRTLLFKFTSLCIIFLSCSIKFLKTEPSFFNWEMRRCIKRQSIVLQYGHASPNLNFSYPVRPCLP